MVSAEKELKALNYEEGLAERLEERHRNLKFEAQAQGRKLNEVMFCPALVISCLQYDFIF